MAEEDKKLTPDDREGIDMPLTIAEAKELLGSGSNDPVSDNGPRVGRAVFIRAIPYFYVGRIVSIDKEWIALSDCAWVANTGRFNEAMKSGKFDEVEPYHSEEPVFVARGCISDISYFTGVLPLGVK